MQKNIKFPSSAPVWGILQSNMQFVAHCSGLGLQYHRMARCRHSAGDWPGCLNIKSMISTWHSLDIYWHTSWYSADTLQHCIVGTAAHDRKVEDKPESRHLNEPSKVIHSISFLESILQERRTSTRKYTKKGKYTIYAWEGKYQEQGTANILTT